MNAKYNQTLGRVIITWVALALSSEALAEWDMDAMVEASGVFPGIRIVGVTPGGPAHRSGLEAGDIIYDVNGQPVNNLTDLRQVFAISRGRNKEMKADFVSGYVLAKAGASQDQATRALRDQFTFTGSITHPDTPKRIASLVAGWQRGKYGP